MWSPCGKVSLCFLPYVDMVWAKAAGVNDLHASRYTWSRQGLREGPMRFEFAASDRIIFGPGTAREVGTLANAFGTRALMITGKQGERAGLIFESLESAGIATVPFEVSHEPTTHIVQAGAERAREAGCDLVVGCGGGSVIDAGKAIAALLTNGGDPLDYLEVIGRGRPITKRSAPYIAVPTTSGTGAEVTRNAVLASPEHRVKVSLRSPLILPHIAVVDPLLTHSMPPAVTASTGLDALTQVLEPYVSGLANPLTDTICREGLTRAARSLRRAFEDGSDAGARQDMALASLFGGLALANAKLGAVHGFAGVLGGMYGAPHGVICGRLLPFATEVNIRALQARDRDNPALARYDETAKIVTGNKSATADDGSAWIQALGDALQVPGLAA
ncbi:MAG: iron-containing alcohol dehydrogenase, partial [Anaerolineae bacterium]|nr:iron-containing alcohol dehydrogenase [Anaerolineae bacterium]